MINRYSLVCLAVCLLFVGCADVDSPQVEVTSYQSMDAWMKKNRPDIPMRDSGFYFKIYDTSMQVEPGKDTLSVSDSLYLEVSVWGELLNGSMFLNSTELKARELGTFTYKTRYKPFRYLSTDYSYYTFTNLGLAEVLSGMKIGDSAVVYLAPEYSYQDLEEGSTVTMYDGFGGSSEFQEGDIAGFTIKLENIETDMDSVSLQRTINYAVNELSIEAKDSIKEGLYIQHLEPISQSELIGEKDTSLYISYVGYFLDGFIFDTNIKEVAIENNIYDVNTSYVPFLYELSSDTTEFGGYIEAFKYAVQNMKDKETAIFVTDSQWAYGVDGKWDGGTLFYPYTPLVFQIQIDQYRSED